MASVRSSRSSIALYLGQVVANILMGCLSVAALTTQAKKDVLLEWCFVICILISSISVYQFAATCWSRASRKISPYIILLNVFTLLLSLSTVITSVVWVASKTTMKDEKEITSYQLGVATVLSGITSCILLGLTTSLSSIEMMRSRPCRQPSETMLLDGKVTSLEILESSGASVHPLPAYEEGKGTKVVDMKTVGSICNGGRPNVISIHSTETIEGRHPGRKVSYGGQRMKSIDYKTDLTPSALSPTGFETRGISQIMAPWKDV